MKKWRIVVQSDDGEFRLFMCGWFDTQELAQQQLDYFRRAYSDRGFGLVCGK